MLGVVCEKRRLPHQFQHNTAPEFLAPPEIKRLIITNICLGSFLRMRGPVACTLEPVRSTVPLRAGAAAVHALFRERLFLSSIETLFQ